MTRISLSRALAAASAALLAPAGLAAQLAVGPEGSEAARDRVARIAAAAVRCRRHGKRVRRGGLNAPGCHVDPHRARC